MKIIITLEYENKSIKQFLKENNIGRGKVEYIRVNKLAKINGITSNIDTILKENDVLSFIIDEKIDFACDDKKLNVIYEDDYVLIVNKPVNMIIHPDDKSKNGTLVNVVANYYKKNNINRKVRFIHRIDKDTTGIVLFAKDFISEARLLKDLQDDKLKRSYLALIEGKMNEEKGIINAPIGQDRHSSNKMCINENGKEAITLYKQMKVYDKYSLVLFSLKTGRTHQIRVHTSYINHPLIGDDLYGRKSKLINRVALHSYAIKFIHPITLKEMSFKANIPLDFAKLIKD